MANALGTLFKDIADAIREKTGEPESVKFKPAQFPEKIASLSVGGGGGSIVEGLTFAKGDFKSTEDVHTVTHDLGYVPDILIVYSLDNPLSLNLQTAISFSSAFVASCPDTDSRVTFMNKNMVLNTMSIKTGHEESLSDFVAGYGFVRNVTSTTFTIGGSSAKLNTTAYTGYTDTGTYTYGRYVWIAVGGIT
jgi:hypothetical protein